MSNINFKFDIFSKVISSSGNNYLIRTKFNVDENNVFSDQCNNWVQHFSTATKTNWIMFKTYPNKQRYAYRKDYVCQHASEHKNQNTEQTDKNRIRNKNCQASIKIVITNETANTLRKDEFLRKGLNTEIKVTLLIKVCSFYISKLMFFRIIHCYYLFMIL